MKSPNSNRTLRLSFILKVEKQVLKNNWISKFREKYPKFLGNSQITISTIKAPSNSQHINGSVVYGPTTQIKLQKYHVEDQETLGYIECKVGHSTQLIITHTSDKSTYSTQPIIPKVRISPPKTNNKKNPLIK